ncbi:endonuclease III [Isosphaeraceae bacterium EP7]
MPSFAEAYPTLVELAPRTLALGGDSPFMAAAAIILGRTLKAVTVRSILAGWADRGLDDLVAFSEADDEEIEEILRVAGIKPFAKLRAVLKRLAAWLLDKQSVDEDWLASARSAESVREELAAIAGIGPNTADAIALHALGLATYPVDRASYRILVRHGWIDESADYEEARSTLMRTDDPAELIRLSITLDRIGREFCRAGRPNCVPCPLSRFLPEGGPCGSEGEE